MFVVDIARHDCALCSLFTRGDDNTRKLFARVSCKYGGVNKWIANDQTVTTPFNQLCLLPSSGIATIFFKGNTVAHSPIQGEKSDTNFIKISFIWICTCCVGVAPVTVTGFLAGYLWWLYLLFPRSCKVYFSGYIIYVNTR